MKGFISSSEDTFVKKSLEKAILCEPARIIVRVIVVGIQKRDAHEAAD